MRMSVWQNKYFDQFENENDKNERKQIGHCENTVSKKNYKNTAIKKIFVKMWSVTAWNRFYFKSVSA